VTNTWLLVPVKGLATGKSRLRPVLDDAARRALNEFLMRRTLANACAFPGAARTLVISECEGVLGVAAGFGVQALAQRSGPGLDQAAREGVDTLRRLGAERIVVLMGDLPLARFGDVEALASRRASARTVVMCPDKNGTGTNALVFSAGAPMSMRFGGASLVWHWRQALRAGLVPRLHHDRRIALDVDTPGDFVQWKLGDDTDGETFGGGCGIVGRLHRETGIANEDRSASWQRTLAPFG